MKYWVLKLQLDKLLYDTSPTAEKWHQLTGLHVKIGRQVANCYRGGTNDPQTICKQSANGLSIVRMVELDSPWNRFHCETYECVKAMSATICKCVMITQAGHQYSRSYGPLSWIQNHCLNLLLQLWTGKISNLFLPPSENHIWKPTTFNIVFFIGKSLTNNVRSPEFLAFAMLYLVAAHFCRD